MTVSPLFVDVYPGDSSKHWDLFCAAGPPWHGAIFKASQGTRFSYPTWLGENVSAFRRAAGNRYGVDLWDGFYHFLDLSVSGAAQADYFMRAVAAAGDERLGTLWGMVDVERGGQILKTISRTQVEDCTLAFATRYQALTGRQATLYGDELLRSVGVRGLMGCGRSAVALYGPELRGRTGGTAELLAAIGTDLEHLLFWQYRGTAPQTKVPKGYPAEAPGCGIVDINAMVRKGGIGGLKTTLWAENPTKLQEAP